MSTGWRDNWRNPPASTLDIPIQRDPIQAMRVTSGSGTQPDNFHDGFKAYVYRGTGFDTLTPDLDEPAKPKRKAKRRKPKPRRPRQPAPVEQYRLGDTRHPDHAKHYATPRKYHVDDPRHPDYWATHPHFLGELTPEEMEARDANLFVVPEPEPDPFEFLETADAPEAFVTRRRGGSDHPRPSPGWTPTTGADIDEWMAEYGVD